MTERITVREARLEDENEVEVLCEILDSYARGPGGQNAPLSQLSRQNLGPGLRDHPNAFVLFGLLEGRVVGIAVCVWSYSTFAGKPSVNLHDFAVLPDARGMGVGTALLEELEQRGRDRGCAKMTLEVHGTNESAKRLYASFGFEGWDPPTFFVAKTL